MRFSFQVPLLFLALLCAMVSCKKNNDKVDTPVPTVDSLITIKTNFTETETLQSLYMDPNGMDNYLYGKRRADGMLTKITGMAVKKRNKSDSILNILYDDSLRVSTMYFIVNGIRDTSLTTFSYTEDTVNYFQYKVDWASGERLLRFKVQLKKNGSAYSTLNSQIYRVDGTTDFFDDAKAMALAMTAKGVGLVMVVGASTVVGYQLGKVPGAFIGFFGGFAIYALLPKNSKAGELTNTPLGSPDDPKSLYNHLKSIGDLLTAHPWYLAAFSLNGVSTFQTCNADDKYTFNANATWTVDPGFNICSPGQTPVFSTWSLLNNDQGIHLNISGYETDFISAISLARVEFSIITSSGKLRKWALTY